ncbi:MAG: P63C domain-containing protein [Thermodesulfobacteriota bacterium]|jgi:hypothetical protein
MEDPSMKDISSAAQTISHLGASKGGIARSLILSKEQRSEIARKAVLARWQRAGVEALPKALYGSPDRPLKLGGAEIPCYVLDDKKRVLVQGAMFSALNMKQGTAGRGPGDRLVKFLSTKSIKPFTNDKLLDVIKNPIKFRIPSGIAHGYEATILADICEAVLEARKEDKLHYQQEHIAIQCEILVRSFARVGIIALVDEATGFQDLRTKEALQEILEQFVAKELQPWVKTFPDDYYKEIFRLNSWPFTTKAVSGKRPPLIGVWTNDIVYDRLAPQVREELHRLAERDEKGRPKHKLFQRLTEGIGHPRLREHLSAVLAVMKISGNWREFKRLLQKALPAYNTNYELPLREGQK